MGEWKKIIWKGLLLVVLLAGLNFAYECWLYPQDAAAYSESARLLRAVQDSSEILYLGESSNFTYDDLDVDKRPISLYLAEYYPDRRLGTVAKGALHAGNYYDILYNVPRSSPVKTVIVTMNLRAFDAIWINSKLETALQKEMVLLKAGPALWRRFMLSLRDYEIKADSVRFADTRAQWQHDTLHFPYPFPYANIAGWDSACAERRVARDAALPPLSDAEVTLACHYIKNFAFQIDPKTNPRIRDFDRIVALAQARGWNLVLNLLPENLEMAEYLVGKDLTLLMRQNRDLLLGRYGKLPGVILVDQLEALGDADFRDRDWCTEHYFERGRRAVADRLANALAPLYPGELRQPVYKQQLARVFQNDCEGKTFWSQVQTLDEQKAHSGKKSSLAGEKSGKFGLTFAYPVASLDTTALDSLDFSCWIYQAGLDHQAMIAWEMGGEKTGYYWENCALTFPRNQANTWQPFHFRVPLWPKLAQAEVVKVYPFNPDQVSIWFDDIRIEFVGDKSTD